MDEKSFLRYVENTRDCEEVRLDLALKSGLRKAKNDSVDFRKFAMLAAACSFTAVMCFSVTLGPLKAAAETYLDNRSGAMFGGSRVLNTHLKTMEKNLKALAETGHMTRFNRNYSK